MRWASFCKSNAIAPRIVITGYADAVFFLEIARQAGGPVDLITQIAASRTMGAAWFACLQDLLTPLASAAYIYDCGGFTGDALTALRHGVRFIRVEHTVLTPALANLAGKHGASITSERGECLTLPADRQGETELRARLNKPVF